MLNYIIICLYVSFGIFTAEVNQKSIIYYFLIEILNSYFLNTLK